LKLNKMNIIASKEPDVESRMAVVESTVKGLEKWMQNVDTAIGTLSKDLHRRDRPNYVLGIMFGTLMLGVLTAFGTVISMKVDGTVQPLTDQLHEVETQFDADAQLRNAQIAQQERLDAILWNSSALGKLTQYPGAPYTQPDIAAKR
jgi:hypothetical protein